MAIDVEQEQLYWLRRIGKDQVTLPASERWTEQRALMLHGYAVFADVRRLSMEQAIKVFESHPDWRRSSLSEQEKLMCFAKVWSRCLQLSTGQARDRQLRPERCLAGQG